ncbi:HD domain-containing protein [Mycobacterium sp. 134]|uniref:HD domain-containing protein n=1 Tax=Mycobacterium sp. 134 TaxID=3400425 RepID=UPI003AACAEEA
MNTNGYLEVQGAQQLATELLAQALPRRWSHTVAVAKTAASLANVLAPEAAAEIVCAAWLHDIGYAPDLIDTGFHPLDGAAYLTRENGDGKRIPAEVISLVAHHTGAAYEARERGLQDLLDSYPRPDETKLAILSCADLCSGPDGAPVDPAERISEVLARYPTDHPVHRAITISAPTLVGQSRRVLQAARDDCRLCQQLVETRQETIARLRDSIALNEAEIAEIKRCDRHTDYHRQQLT